MDGAFIVQTLRALLGGVPLTLELTFLSVAIGVIMAVAFAVLRANFRIGSWLVRAYVFFFRGSPLLVQMFLIYYGLGQFPSVRESFAWFFLRDPFSCAVLALALNTAAYGSEIIRGGLNAVPPGAIEAGRVAGMPGVVLYRRIILPLAIRQALPAYGNEIVTMVKSTALASMITLMEVTGIAYRIVSETYRALDVFLCAGVIYLVLTFAIGRAVWLLERWLATDGAAA
jgi:octopine/nopaline transport system permease protein